MFRCFVCEAPRGWETALAAAVLAAVRDSIRVREVPVCGAIYVWMRRWGLAPTICASCYLNVWGELSLSVKFETFEASLFVTQGRRPR